MISNKDYTEAWSRFHAVQRERFLLFEWRDYLGVRNVILDNIAHRWHMSALAEGRLKQLLSPNYRTILLMFEQRYYRPKEDNDNGI